MFSTVKGSGEEGTGLCALYWESANLAKEVYEYGRSRNLIAIDKGMKEKKEVENYAQFNHFKCIRIIAI